MKTIVVVAALIKQDDSYLIGLRSSGKYKGYWEFPGGKVEDNETLEVALIREIKEEFNVDLIIDQYLVTIEHDYDEFNLLMHCFQCRLNSLDLTLNDHSEIAWYNPKDDKPIRWLEADLKIVEYIKGLV
jgi:8-oxo-dGTP diphosphatase